MFEIGKTYWIITKNDKFDKITAKGKVIEETPFMVKILRDNNKTEIIVLSQILRVNEAEETSTQKKEQQM